MIQYIYKGIQGVPWGIMGLSTDVKPTLDVPVGSKFTAVDTGAEFRFDGTIWYPIVDHATIVASLPNTTLVEQKTQVDAVAGVLTFSANIGAFEIFNTDATNAGVFVINGITVNVPATKVFNAAIGGTPSVTVTVTGATTYIVSRYV